jgi:hypothetical protein
MRKITLQLRGSPYGQLAREPIEISLTEVSTLAAALSAAVTEIRSMPLDVEYQNLQRTGYRVAQIQMQVGVIYFTLRIAEPMSNKEMDEACGITEP